MALLSSGEVAKRLGLSMTGTHKLVRAGVLPTPIVIEGSGRFVWLSSEWPSIEKAFRERPNRRRQGAAAA
jgi:predicted DNA-binding transcriptional regulator AlpA